MKILNLYGGIGGNRMLWGNEHEITTIEINPNIAKIYQNFFPQDNIIIGDAHQYLLKYFKEFDFIWSSPPCISHSKVRFVNWKQNKPIYPDLSLYQEILFLQNYFKGKFVVENVNPFYKPLIDGQKIGRHIFWANFKIAKKDFPTESHSSSKIKLIAKKKGLSFDFNSYGENKVKLLRNAIQPEIALHIFKMAFIDKQKRLFEAQNEGSR